MNEKKCIACEGGLPPLTHEEIQNNLKKINNWHLNEKLIHKRFEFKDFSQAMDFVNKIANIAAEQGHHPDIKVSYNIVDVDLSTHAVNGLTLNDFIVASLIDDLTF